MWKQTYLVTLILSVPVLSKFSPNNVISKILDRLGLNLDYISLHYDRINVDCLLGVVLAEAILDDSFPDLGIYEERVKILKAKTKNIYFKAIPVMEATQPKWEEFLKHVVVPNLWSRHIYYKLSAFRMVYPMKSYVKSLFSPSENYTHGFTDHCLSLVVNETLSLRPNTICHLSTKCEQYVENVEEGSGYLLTHKLLILQVARARKCKMHPKILSTLIKKGCRNIYKEAISVEYFVGLDEIFDLFLEQSLFCAYEGYADFLKSEWLEKILAAQHDSGCFSARVRNKTKRDVNQWKDGCADHTTGLGAAVLSLYLNYLLKNAETLALIDEWN